MNWRGTAAREEAWIAGSLAAALTWVAFPPSSGLLQGRPGSYAAFVAEWWSQRTDQIQGIVHLAASGVAAAVLYGLLCLAGQWSLERWFPRA